MFELDQKTMYDRMSKGWVSGKKDGTICGSGSTLESTKPIRESLPKIISKYGIKWVSDAGCGDLHWIKNVDLGQANYQGYDLVPRRKDVIKIDITTEVLPNTDLIICRDVFIHLSTDRILAALKNFRIAGKYLLTTSYDDGDNTSISAEKPFTKINLLEEPFCLPQPLEKIEEPNQARWMGLWSLQ